MLIHINVNHAFSLEWLLTLKAPSDPDKSKVGAVTLVLLQANQIVRDPATIGKTMKALGTNKSANGLLKDTREWLGPV